MHLIPAVSGGVASPLYAWKINKYSVLNATELIITNLKTYLVGGAVRDKLLGLPVKDRDWVVVGASPEQMLELGYEQVGKDFPVFLHPETKEEYALARTEKKSGTGHTGFTVDASETVTLEEDLLRRDLTINAMAEDEDGNLIDPYGGREDLNNKILRHVSDAFTEDPLRVLRVARFSARFAHLGFEVAQETLQMMEQLVNSTEMNTLPAERIWQEVRRALSEKTPAFFFLTLRDCYALGTVLQEIEGLFGISQEKARLSLMALTKAAELTPDTAIRFAALCHELGVVHEFTLRKNLRKLHSLCERLKVPNDHRELAEIVCSYCDDYARIDISVPESILKLFENTDAFRRPERFQFFLTSCKAIGKARGETDENLDHMNGMLQRALDTCLNLDTSSLQDAGYEGEEFGIKLYELRLQTIKDIFSYDS
ncbi:MAG: multifunctional CCA addition/repair protein [Gammaproteobacteria bacterium]|nr:multifunctional CCA addition/repair protein [Gammaproteobacteria bacterium]